MSASQKIHDVLFFGAGLSCIGAACYLQKRQPRKTYAILEAREDLGGTWDLFRFPGIRSDSDLFTFGYEFKPWESEKRLADGPEIKAYLGARFTFTRHAVRPRSRVLRAALRRLSGHFESDRAWAEQAAATDGAHLGRAGRP